MGRPRKPKEHAAVGTAEELQTALTNGQIPEPEPGNETAPDAKARRGRRTRAEDAPKAVDLPHMNGRGVALNDGIEDGELEALGDEWDKLTTQKRKIAEKITACDTKAQERMAALGLKSYRYSDREIYLKEGKDHVKVRAVKADNNGEHEDKE